MAARSMKALSQRVIEELVSKSSKATSPILLPFEKSEEDAEGYNMVVVFPVMVRAGGFMVASPSSPVAQAALEAVDWKISSLPSITVRCNWKLLEVVVLAKSTPFWWIFHGQPLLRFPQVPL